jgi:hypothetical protein
MTRQSKVAIGLHLVLAGGIVISTALAASGSIGRTAGVILFALLILAVDMMAGRLKGQSMAPTFSAILMSAAFLLACGIVALKNPGLVAMLIPVLGCSTAIPILSLSRTRRACSPGACV